MVLGVFHLPFSRCNGFLKATQVAALQRELSADDILSGIDISKPGTFHIPRSWLTWVDWNVTFRSRVYKLISRLSVENWENRFFTSICVTKVPSYLMVGNASVMSRDHTMTWFAHKTCQHALLTVSLGEECLPAQCALELGMCPH